MVLFPVTLSDRQPRLQSHMVIIDTLDILCAQLTRDLFAIATFLFVLMLRLAYNVVTASLLTLCIGAHNAGLGLQWPPSRVAF